MTRTDDRTFTGRSARSGSLLAGLLIAVSVETVILHLWLRATHPMVAWSLTLLSVTTLLWLIADYRALERPIILVTEDALRLTVGNRARAELPLTQLAAISQPSWRDIPAPERAREVGYRNLMKPAEPNVLLHLTTPALIRGPSGMQFHARLIGLRLDDAAGFCVAVEERRAERLAPRQPPARAT